MQLFDDMNEAQHRALAARIRKLPNLLREVYQILPQETESDIIIRSCSQRIMTPQQLKGIQSKARPQNWREQIKPEDPVALWLDMDDDGQWHQATVLDSTDAGYVWVQLEKTGEKRHFAKDDPDLQPTMKNRGMVAQPVPNSTSLDP